LPNGRSHFLAESDPGESAKATRGAGVVRARASTPSKGDTRARIIEAAREAFSTMGFEGASLRSVAKEAGVQHQLATYYFKTKEELWMAVMDELAIGFFARLGERIRGLEGVDAPTKLRLVVREFVKYSAEYPQLHRLMTMEGRRESERLAWLIKRHVSRFYSISTKLIREAQATGVVRPGDPGQLHYCAIGIATSAFSLAPEYKLVTGNDPFARSHIEQIADLVCDFLFVRPEKDHQRRNK
jgi:TetR/AcrR family transcriptional regulator